MEMNYYLLTICRLDVNHLTATWSKAPDIAEPSSR